MPNIHPFHVVRYAAALGADISTRIAPPYDVLDEGPKRQLLQKDPHNIVAVDLPVTPPKTVGPDSAYAAAGALYRQWLDSGVLKREPQTALVAYEQRFRNGETLHRRRGFFAAVDLEDYGRSGGGIHRHEQTISGGTEDRLRLMRATAAQLSPVFGIFDDPQGRVAGILAPLLADETCDFQGRTEHDSVQHRCRMITDPKIIQGLQEAVRSTDVVIADGHHRYVSALNHHRSAMGPSGSGRCLFVLVPLQDPGLIVHPTHRVACGLTGFSIAQLAQALTADGQPFQMAPTDHGGDGLPGLVEELPGMGPHAMGLYDPTSGRTYCVSATHADPLKSLQPQMPQAWRELDVAILHNLLVDRILRPRFGGEAITCRYTHDLTDLMHQVHDQPGRLGILLQPLGLPSICAVARSGQIMPPKSTFFWPKLATGLVIHPMV